jgi:hypothetical protein
MCPLTEKGESILAALEKEYGEKKGKEVLFAGKNKGTFTGIDSRDDADFGSSAGAKRMKFGNITIEEKGGKFVVQGKEYDSYEEAKRAANAARGDSEDIHEVRDRVVDAACRSLQDSMIGIERAAKRMDAAVRDDAEALTNIRCDDAAIRRDRLDALCDDMKARAPRADAEAILRDDSPLDDKIARVRALYDRPGTAGEKQAAYEALRRLGVDPASIPRQPEQPRRPAPAGPKRFRVTLKYEVNGKVMYFGPETVEASDSVDAEGKVR